MKIAVGYTKTGCDNIIEAFSKGVADSGDSILEVKTRDDVWKIEQADAMVQVAESGRSEVLEYYCGSDTIDDFHFIKTYMGLKQIELKKPRLIIDSGVLKDSRFVSDEERYFSVGLNGIKGRAKYFNTDSPSDRWEKRGLRTKPWRVDGDHVLIIGQSKKGAGLLHVGSKALDEREKYWNTPSDYYEDLPRRIRKFAPNRKILFRGHMTGASIAPSYTLENMEAFETSVENHVPISEHLKNAWCAITRTSNGAVDALLEGIPVITEDRVCLAHSVAENSIKKIDSIKSPPMSSYVQWLYDMAYVEWSLDEMRKGLPWQHFRKHICKPT